MIAAHLEPKGLDPDTPAFGGFLGDAERKDDATLGSAKLRDAILLAKGYTPVVIPFPSKPPVFKPRKCKPKARKGWRKARTPNAKIEQIKALVADHFELSVRSLMSRCKRDRIARPRQIAMYLARKTTTASYPDIALLFGGRDHTTVIHAVRMVEKRSAAGDRKTVAALISVHAVIGG